MATFSSSINIHSIVRRFETGTSMSVFVVPVGQLFFGSIIACPTTRTSTTASHTNSSISKDSNVIVSSTGAVAGFFSTANSSIYTTARGASGSYTATAGSSATFSVVGFLFTDNES